MLLLTCLTFLLLSASLGGEECVKPCQCCSDGRCIGGHDKCQGCMYGYSGEKCNIPCPINCINCSQTYFSSAKICPVCKNGFYNGRYQDEPTYTLQENCALSCKPGCATCASYNRCLKCMEGHFLNSGRECSSCPMNCKQCNTETTCINCTESYYWDSQARRCQHCKFRCKACKTYDTCSKCEDGYFVEENECKTCHEGCISCANVDSCRICDRSYLQLNDICVRCKSHCNDCEYDVQRSYICNSCTNGHFLFNNTCYESCGEGCDQCLTNTQCNFCDKDYFGIDGRCVICPVNCLSCSSKSNCTQCVPGYHSYDCSLPCPGNCKECHMVNGTCFACHNGYFLGYFKGCGRCPVHCADCTSSSLCLICRKGYKGRTCSEKCYNCREGTKCDQSTGYCRDNCRDGLSGTNCSVKCSANCLTCERQNAHKCKICASNWFGPECSSQCPLHCKSSACVTDGRCTLGCDKGYWGSQCDKDCSNLCERKVCDIDYGTCTHGCVENYTDNNCVCFKNCMCDSNDTCYNCKNGFFGGMCENRCSVGCIDQVCSKYTGICSGGCKNGFKGSRCKEGVFKVNKDCPPRFMRIEGFAKLSLWLNHVLPIASSVLILIVLIALIAHCITRKRILLQSSGSSSRGSETATDIDRDYTALRGTFMEPTFPGAYTGLSIMPTMQDAAGRDYKTTTDSDL